MNLLMIGNSFCYYYVEELYGIAKAAGIDMTVTCEVGFTRETELWRNIPNKEFQKKLYW